MLIASQPDVLRSAIAFIVLRRGEKRADKADPRKQYGRGMVAALITRREEECISVRCQSITVSYSKSA